MPSLRLCDLYFLAPTGYQERWCLFLYLDTFHFQWLIIQRRLHSFCSPQQLFTQEFTSWSEGSNHLPIWKLASRGWIVASVGGHRAFWKIDKRFYLNANLIFIILKQNSWVPRTAIIWRQSPGLPQSSVKYALGSGAKFRPHCRLWAPKYIMSSIFMPIVPNSLVEGCDVADDSKYGGGLKQRSEYLNSTIILAKPSKYC